MMTSRRIVVLTALAVLVAGRSAAQSPPDPVKTAIGGYDTVAYFTEGKPMKGDPALSHVWDGQRYLFATERHRQLFAAQPDKYAPQFAGKCAAGLAGGYAVDADPEHFLISEGRLYLFEADRGAPKMKADPGLAGRADATWKSLGGRPLR